MITNVFDNNYKPELSWIILLDFFGSALFVYYIYIVFVLGNKNLADS